MKIAPQHRTMKDFYLYLDAGHGGIDPTTCEYTTAPSKMFDHGDTYTFHEGGKFYEGVFNREIAARVKKKMANIMQERFCIPVYHPYEDTPLHNRTNYANKLYKGGQDGILISIHANAGKGTGFEVFTSPGNTKSDLIAEFIYNEVQKRIPDYRMRPDISDGDPDKEAPFWMLTKSAMPAVLIECGFFDNHLDAERMMDSIFQDKIAAIIVQAWAISADL